MPSDDLWFTALQDWAHDAGASLCWGKRMVATTGKLRERHWCHLQMPTHNGHTLTVEHMGATRGAAAWAVLHELEPDTQDLPEAA